MDPFTGLGLILGLIPLWQRERDKSSAATQREFFAWLISHNFEDIQKSIADNYVLCSQIEQLLQMNHEELKNNLQSVDKKLLQILYSIDEFRGLIKALAPQVVLTSQEEALLAAFVRSEASEMSFEQLYETGNELHGPCFDNKMNDSIKLDSRFVRKNLDSLVNSGYIFKIRDYVYALSETAIEYVANISKSSLSEQAESILKQFVESSDQYLLTYIDEDGIGIQTEKTSIEVNEEENRLLHDDLDSLEKKGLISFDGALKGGGRRYRTTRAGMDYIKKA